MKILALNAGSSSQKSRLYAIERETGQTGVHRTQAAGVHRTPLLPPKPMWEAEIDWGQRPGVAVLRVETDGGATLQRELPAERQAALAAMIETLWAGPACVVSGPSEIDGVGHRVVHGGLEYEESVRVTPQVTAAIGRMAVIAPEHNPAALDGMAVVERMLGASTPQVAVFDTAFHAHMPQAAAVYPGPYAWFEQGIRRFGFHGISYQYCSERAAQLLGRDLAATGVHRTPLRLIICHLGNGCSLAAIAGGRSVDTTMGFTPMEGLMMGTRSGSVDPGILTYLLRERGASGDSLDRTLNHESGLKGISGVSGDMRSVLAARDKGNPRAVLAFDMFVHRLRFSIGAMLAVLGGLDALVFTGGIGEHSPEVRAGACEAFGFVGIRLDAARNAQSPHDANVAADDSSVPVLVIQTQEDWMVARECWRVLRRG
ncbi:MAG TPA: acetate kinase [Ktedonobacterales bacterium]